MAKDYVMQNGSVLTKDRIVQAEDKINFYRQYIKKNDISDLFYEADLAVFEEGLYLMKRLLDKANEQEQDTSKSEDVTQNDSTSNTTPVKPRQ